jgi:protein-S-isoprenylcysteine O-methyltransferase Ste14
MFGYSTVIFEVVSFPPLFIGTVVFLSFGLYFISKSHKAVFNDGQTQAKLINSGVYGFVRHPMYLGILLFCLSFLFISVSLLSIAIWIAFFIFYDKMATYEKKSLTEILGEEYVNYQKRVPKWLLNFHRS